MLLTYDINILLHKINNRTRIFRFLAGWARSEVIGEVGVALTCSRAEVINDTETDH